MKNKRKMEVERDVKMPTVRKGAEEAASREERVCTNRGFLSQRWHANATVEIIIIATNHNLPYVQWAKYE